MTSGRLLRGTLFAAICVGLFAARPAWAGGDAVWKGRWVWCASAPAQPNIYVYARRTFDLEAVPRTAPMRITADSRYKVWVNGRLVGRGPARSDPAWWYYDRFDIAPMLRSGRNVIAVQVFHHHGTFQYLPGPAGLLAEVKVGGETIVSDPSWRVLRAEAYRQDLPKMGLQLAAPEEFDARKDPAGWREPDFDDSAWEPAAVVGPAGMAPHANLVARDIPPLRETVVPPAKLLGLFEAGQGSGPVWERMQNEPLNAPDGLDVPKLFRLQTKAWPSAGDIDLRIGARPAVLVLDMGAEMLGFPRVRVKAPAGTVVDLGYSEVQENGRVVPNRAGVKYADRFVCREGENEFELFTPRAFRYLQVDIAPPAPGASVTIQQIAQNHAVYPTEHVGAFECSDPLLNRVWSLGRYTVEQCMEDGYTDCPWRERGQWWGDARAEAMSTYYAFGDARLIRKAILQIGQGQRADGITPGVWPADFDNRYLPDFCLIWVMTLDDYVRFTGDVAFARQLEPKIQRALKWFDKFRDKDGLLRDVPGWVFIDWADIDKQGACTALNAFYVGALDAASRLEARLGNRAEADRCAQAAETHRATMRRLLWSDADGAFSDALHNDGKLSATVSEQANALGILYGITPPEKRARVFARLDEASGKPAVRCGSPYFSLYWLWAMLDSGRADEAVEYMRRWKVMLDADATTAWEVWNAGASLCHGWSSGPTSLLPAWVLGVRPTADGMREVIVAPQPAGLAWARGAVPTPRGPVQVSWKLDGGTMALDLTVPRGVTCRVQWPGKPTAVSLKRGKAAGGPDGSLRLGPGVWSIEAAGLAR